MLKVFYFYDKLVSVPIPFNLLHSEIYMDKTMADKIMYNIPNDNTQNFPFVDKNKMIKRLNTKLSKPNNQNSIKSTKVVKPTNKKML